MCNKTELEWKKYCKDNYKDHFTYFANENTVIKGAFYAAIRGYMEDFWKKEKHPINYNRNKRHPKRVKFEDLSAPLGLDSEYFGKILKMEEITYNRDYILYACILLCLTGEEMEDAITAYSIEARLRGCFDHKFSKIEYNDDRDFVFVDFYNVVKDGYSDGFKVIGLLNDKLKNYGISIRGNNSHFVSLNNQLKNNILKKYSGFIKADFDRDQYPPSLSEENLPNEYDTFIATVKYQLPHDEILIVKGKAKFLSGTDFSWQLVDSFGEISDTSENLNLPSNESNDSEDSNSFEKIEDHKKHKVYKYSEYFYDVNQLIKSKKTEYLLYKTDTKNYPGRKTAFIKDGKLLVFYEEFNYDNPMRKEYVSMEFFKGKYIFRASRNSLFMGIQAKNSKYEKFFTDYSEKSWTFDSINEIKENLSKINGNPVDYDTLTSWINNYNKLFGIVNKIIDNIKNMSEPILSVDNFDNADFEARIAEDEESYIMQGGKSLIDWDKIDLKLCLSLGLVKFSDINDVLRINENLDNIYK